MRASTALVAVLAACHGTPAEEAADELPAVKVTCAAVVESDVEEAVEVSGVIAPPPKVDAVISSPVAGRVAQVLVEEGDAVAAGALLATIEDPALPAGTIEARAQVASAKAANETAQLELARQERLVTQGIGARRDVEDARAKAAAAAAELDAATARSTLASRQLARRELRAPYPGIVLHVWKRTGESVDGTGTTPVVEVADVATLEVRAQVAPGALVKLHDGEAATVRVAGVAATATASVARVAPAVDPTTLLGTVRVQLAGRQTFPIGSAATARIVVGRHRGLVVPAEALRRSKLGTDEVVRCAGGVAKAQAVTLGDRTPASVEVTTGLAAGSKVVVDHVLGIEDGQKLEDAEPAR